jgi:hypothetical protein
MELKRLMFEAFGYFKLSVNVNLFNLDGHISLPVLFSILSSFAWVQLPYLQHCKVLWHEIFRFMIRYSIVTDKFDFESIF